MQINLNVFQKALFEGVSKILLLLEPSAITCTLARRDTDHVTFRVYRGKPEDIMWTHEGFQEGEQIPTRMLSGGVVSWASPSNNSDILVEVVGETTSGLINACYPLIKNLKREQKGVVNYWC